MAWNKELYYRRKAVGNCVYCDNKATHGIFCHKHKIKSIDKCRKSYKKHRIKTIDNIRKRDKIRIDKGLCRTCGIKLENEIDGSAQRCINCNAYH